MKLTVKKMSQVLVLEPKAGEKSAPKFLWALIDECENTFIQVYDEKYPTKFIKTYLE